QAPQDEASRRRDDRADGHPRSTSRYRSATSSSEGMRITARRSSSSESRRAITSGSSSVASKGSPASPTSSEGHPLASHADGVSWRSQWGLCWSAENTSEALLGLADQLPAMSRSLRPPRGSRAAGG